MQPQSQSLKNLKCHFEDSDSIPIEKFCRDPNSFVGDLFLFCEKNHVLHFLKNPKKSILAPSSTTEHYVTFQDSYRNFFKKCENVTFEQLINIINLRQLDYWAGTSFAIRLFLESLIYQNYGIFAWYGEIKLREKTDKGKIEDVNNKIGRLGFSTFMNIVISNKWKEDLTSGDSNLIENRYKLKDDRLSYAVEAAENLKKITTNPPWISLNKLKKVQKVFEDLSPLVHARNVSDPSVVDSGLVNVLDAYEEFYSNNNQWRITYE